MTKTEEILVALMEFDPEPLVRFLKTLSEEDLVKLELGLRLATAATFREENDREIDSNSARLNRESVKRLEARMREVQTDVMWGAR